jgi:hypothetical protein
MVNPHGIPTYDELRQMQEHLLVTNIVGALLRQLVRYRAGEPKVWSVLQALVGEGDAVDVAREGGCGSMGGAARG